MHWVVDRNTITVGKFNLPLKINKNEKQSTLSPKIFVTLSQFGQEKIQIKNVSNLENNNIKITMHQELWETSKAKENL